MENIFQHFYARGARRFLFLASCNIKENRPEGFGFDAEAKISGFERALAAHPEATGRVLRPESRGSTRWPANTTWPGR